MLREEHKPYLYMNAGMKSLQSFGVTANELRIVGGGSKNKLWRQIIADSFQLPLRFPTEPESAALGGALQAAAVYNNASVADFILENEPPLADEVGTDSIVCKRQVKTEH